MIRWGIAGTGRIAQCFADSMRPLADAGHPVAVSGSDAARVRQFAGHNHIEYALSHAELVRFDRIDAVYVCMDHPGHYIYALAALQHGKAVLCEKPAALTGGELTHLTETAAAKHLLFAEAYMYRFGPQMAELTALLRQGAIGYIRSIEASFGFEAPYDPTSRLYRDGQSGGAIYDVGGYPSSLAGVVAGVALGQTFADCREMSGSVIRDCGIDVYAEATLAFDQNIVAKIAAACDRRLSNTLHVQGTHGEITLADPWAASRTTPPDCRMTLNHGGKSDEQQISYRYNSFTYEIAAFMTALQNGQTELAFPALSGPDSIKNLKIMEKWRKFNC